MTAPAPEPESPRWGRRDLLLGGFLRRARPPAPAAAPAAIVPAPRALAVLRPPGAAPERELLAACAACPGPCVSACPERAIALVPAPGGGHAPRIDPDQAPCRMCADLPCVTACPAGALSRDRPRAIGRAQLLPQDCLAHQGTTCSACVEQCPEPGALRLHAGRPAIDAGACTGCGVCRYVCPAPRNAIVLLPRAADVQAAGPGASAPAATGSEPQPGGSADRPHTGLPAWALWTPPSGGGPS